MPAVVGVSFHPISSIIQSYFAAFCLRSFEQQANYNGTNNDPKVLAKRMAKTVTFIFGLQLQWFITRASDSFLPPRFLLDLTFDSEKKIGTAFFCCIFVALFITPIKHMRLLPILFQMIPAFKDWLDWFIDRTVNANFMLIII